MADARAPLKLAIVGCGFIAHRHAEVARAMPHRIELAAACDVDGDKAAALARTHGIGRMARELDDLLREGGLDAVLLCLPHRLHAEAAVAAAEAGLHVLVEKPIAATLDEADRMIEAAARRLIRSSS